LRIQLFLTVARDYGTNLVAAELTEEQLDANGYANQNGLSRKVWLSNLSHCCAGTLFFQHIFESVKASLERLQLDYVDVLQCK
jgi:diketogulonate reductase-like aldo/keto reductase